MPKRRKYPRGMFKQEGRSSFAYRRMEGGVPYFESLGRDEQAARGRTHELNRRFDGGGRPPAKMTLPEAFEKYCEVRVSTRRTNEKDKRHVRRRGEMYLIEFFGSVPLARITTERGYEYAHWLSTRRSNRNPEKTLSPQSVCNILTEHIAFFNWCVKVGWISRSPLLCEMRPRVHKRPPDRLPEEQLRKVLALPYPWGYTAWVLLAWGLRYSETVRARVEDVDFNTGDLLVRKAKSGRPRTAYCIAPGILPEVRIRALEQGGKLIPFRGESGAFNEQVKKRAAMPDFRSHRLRKTNLCLWADSGASDIVLQKAGGHATVETTRIYADPSRHVVRRHLEEVQVVAKVVAGDYSAAVSD
jgi:integrase